MFEVMHVGRPGSRVRIHCPRDKETAMSKLAGGREKKLFETGLTIRRIGAEIGEITFEVRGGFDAVMNGRIDPSVERGNDTRAEF